MASEAFSNLSSSDEAGRRVCLAITVAKKPQDILFDRKTSLAIDDCVHSREKHDGAKLQETKYSGGKQRAPRPRGALSAIPN
jgi:hypothetical protein